MRLPVEAIERLRNVWKEYELLIFGFIRWYAMMGNILEIIGLCLAFWVCLEAFGVVQHAVRAGLLTSDLEAVIIIVIMRDSTANF